MELQLGLALSLPAQRNASVKGFDVTNTSHMPSLDIWSYGCGMERQKKKRSFDMAFEKIGDEDHDLKTLPLLLWHGQPGEEDDDGKRQKKISLNDATNGEGDQVVGWPPIKSWRKKMLFSDHQNHGHGCHGHHEFQNHHQNNIVEKEEDESENSMYVKVKMRGVGILRKTDIKLHHSYQTLRDSLISMFATCKEWESDDVADLIVTYQDKNGNWLLAGDVPWQTFVESVQRLEIIRKYR